MVSMEQMVQSAIDEEKSGNQFPVDFDDIWVAAGYFRKDAAYKFLSERCKGLKPNTHYVYRQMAENPLGGRPIDKYFFSLRAVKFFLTRSNTPEGDSALWSLIEIEEAYLAYLERQLNSTSTPTWVSDISTQMSTLH
ncbi:MAG: hypothetical protein ACRCYP_01140, partial [Alphaproteobacteria bacterium]